MSKINRAFDRKPAFTLSLLSFLSTASLIALSPAALANEAPAASAVKIEIKKPLIPVSKDFTLKNGLRVVLSEDHSVPVASVALIYDVGAKDETKGRSGFAHLFEHMMFQGSDNIAKAEHSKYVTDVGGSDNASTRPDFTNYFERVPSNQLELCLWLESDRMRSLKVIPANLTNQLETVKEEKRMRIDNQAYVPANLRMEELALDNWNNAHPVIGNFADLEAASVKDVRDFFNTYYTPNNCTMAIVGDIDSEATAKLVQKYFDSIPRGAVPQRKDLTEPKQVKARYEKIEDPLASMPAFWMTWKAPARRDADFYALNLLQNILSDGDSSRLYQRMVKGDKVALSASASYDERRGPSLFETFVVYKSGNSPEKVRQIVLDELHKLAAEDVSDEELQKAKNQILRNLFSSGGYTTLQKSLNRAEMLAEYKSFYNDTSLIDSDIEQYMKVTKEDLRKLAAKIFTAEGVTTVDVVPKAKKEG